MMADDIPEINDDFVAFAKAGIDTDFTIFKLYTRKLVDEKTGETGQFDLKCSYQLTTLENSHAPQALLKELARRYVMHAVKSTTVPIEYWILEFSPVMSKFGVPSHLFFDTARDRVWLA
jgi:hypothetical protein